MSDFQIKVGGDFNELLRGFQQLEARAQQSGQVIGQRIDQGIQKFSTSSIAGLQAELNRLQQRQLTVGVNTAAFDALSKRIAEIGSQIDAANRKKVTVNTDPRSIAALRGQLGELQDELNRVAIGSQRFKELTAAIQATERELSKAGEASEDFRILDGVVQGIAFSLSNAVVDGAQRAIGALGGLVQEFGRLDTEFRKAAAASGEAGAYDEIARAVEQVGIEAAGTTMEVAQLYTELVRGGMTVAQANASLASIVRGAEATGTSFDQMGSVVSASLKGFGLQAQDAQRVVDALVQGANASAASVSGMGMAFKYAAPVAKILGVSVEDLGIAIGLLTNAGIDASEAGVTLRNGLSKLASAAPQAGGGMKDLTGQAAMAAKSMKSLGVNIYNANGTLQPMETVLLKLKGAFDKLEPSSKIRLAANLFGGEDDGAKWLALLNQSEEEIKKMATAMASTKGATDTARDAMQGFELKIKALEGSLGAIGNTFGMVTAGAMLPFLDLANRIVGAIVALPGPLKAAVAAVTVLAGSVVVATAGLVAFNMALASTQVQSTIAGIKAFAAALATNLAGAATVGIVAMQGLYNAIRGFTFQAFFSGVQQLATILRTQLVAAAQVAQSALAAMLDAIKSGAFASAVRTVAGEIGGLVAGALRLAAVVAPLAIAYGIVSQAMAGASEASDRYKKANDKIVEALAKLRSEIGKTDTTIKESRNAFQLLFDSFKEGAMVMADSDYAQKLEDSLAGLNKEAKAYLDTIGKTGKLTEQQTAKANAYVVALQSTGGSVQAVVKEFESLAKRADVIGDRKLAEVYRGWAKGLQESADAASKTGAQLAAKTRITAQDIVATGQATEATKERADAERELNQLIASAPVRQADARLAVGQQLLGLTQAISEQEQSQFSLRKAALEYELSKAQERQAGEGVIRNIRNQIIAVEKEAITARYSALLAEQQIQQQLLQISQEKARTEANLAALEQQSKALDAQSALGRAQQSGKQAEIDQAQAQLNLQLQILQIRRDAVSLLGQTQPIEAQILATQQATARAGLEAQAAQLGVKTALAESAMQGQQLAGSAQLASGSMGAMAGQAGATSAGLSVATQQTQALATGVAGVTTQLDGAGQAAGAVKAGLATAQTGIEGVGDSAVTSAGKFSGLTQAVADTAEAARLGATVAKVFSAASGSIGGIAKAMASAANSARDFLGYLQQASGLPGSRWTGGPVDAGQSYRINDGPAGRSLGQESFLSAAGKLSLINRPANSLWTPPTSGVVIPAGVTETLKARGAFDSGRMVRAAVASRPSAPQQSGDGQLAATVARQAVAIGKLEQAVDRLTQKDWNVSVRVRGDGTGLQYLNQLNRAL